MVEASIQRFGGGEISVNLIGDRPRSAPSAAAQPTVHILPLWQLSEDFCVPVEAGGGAVSMVVAEGGCGVGEAV
jgi:hypothetical protein